jgi:hypothetical protein
MVYVFNDNQGFTLLNVARAIVVAVRLIAQISKNLILQSRSRSHTFFENLDDNM